MIIIVMQCNSDRLCEHTWTHGHAVVEDFFRFVIVCNDLFSTIHRAGHNRPMNKQRMHVVCEEETSRTLRLQVVQVSLVLWVSQDADLLAAVYHSSRAWLDIGL